MTSSYCFESLKILLGDGQTARTISIGNWTLVEERARSHIVLQAFGSLCQIRTVPHLEVYHKYSDDFALPLPCDMVFNPEEYNRDPFVVYFLVRGVQIKDATGRRDLAIITYDSSRSIDQFTRQIGLEIALQRQTEQRRGALFSDRLGKPELYSLRVTDPNTQLLTGSNILTHLIRHPVLYLDYSQHAYSATPPAVFRQFCYPEDIEDPDETIVFQNLCEANTREAEAAVDAFLTTIRLPEHCERYRRWQLAVERAVTVLEDCVTTLPDQDVQSDATRRMMTDAVILQVSKYLTTQLRMGVTLCHPDGQPPKHWQGYGTLDYILGIQHPPVPTTTAAQPDAASSEGMTPPFVVYSDGVTPPFNSSSLSARCIDTPAVILTYPKAAHVARVQQEGGVLEEEPEEYGSDSDSDYSTDSVQILTEPVLVQTCAGDSLSTVSFPPVLPYNTSDTVNDAGLAVSAVALRQLSAQCHDVSYVSHQDLYTGTQHEAPQRSTRTDRWKGRKRTPAVRFIPSQLLCGLTAR